MFFRKKEETLVKKKKYEIEEIQTYVIEDNNRQIVRTLVYCKKGKRSCVKIHDFVLEEV